MTLKLSEATFRHPTATEMQTGTAPKRQTTPSPYRSSAKANRAILRARLIAIVSFRWQRMQFPDIRLGMMRPRSVKKFRNRFKSLKSKGVDS